MTRSITILLCLTAAMSLAADDMAWNFNGADAEGWTLGPRTENLKVAGGKLQFDITGKDPWIIGPTMDITATAGTRLIIRMSSEDGTHGQIYWQSIGEDGKPLPFSEERVVRSFSCASDGRMHEYYILPTWRGKVTRLRLDPPGETGHVEIDSIRIQTVEIPLATELQAEFAASDSGYWIPQGMRIIRVEHGILNAEVDYTGRIGATMKGLGLIQNNDEGSALVRPNLAVDTKENPIVAVRMSVTDGTLGCVRWYSDLDPNSHGSWQDFFLQPDGRFHTYNLDLKQHPTWKGTLRRIELIINSSAGSEVRVDYVRGSKTPQGPPRLEIGYLSTERVLYQDGQDAKVRCLLRNEGGTQLRDVKAVIQVPGPEGAYEQITTVPVIEPGQACKVSWTLKTEGSLAALLGGCAICEDCPYPRDICPLIVTGPRDGSMVVGNARVRLSFSKNSYGYGPATLEINRGLWWESSGILPSLGEVLYRSKDGRVFQKMLFGKGNGREFKAEFDDVDGVRWTAEVKFTPSPEAPWIKAEYSIQASADRQLLAFRGPMLYAGEGSFGAEKDAALFPGLEWLVKGERSSNWLDATPPRSNRWAPDPYKVTIPLMAVLADRKLVGVMWNALDKWDGEHNCVTANFLSPNYHDAQENHKMSLFVPSIPEWVVENSLLATKPYELKKGTKLTIACHIFAQEADDVLQAVKNWFQVYGVPGLQDKPRSDDEELDLCMDYFNSRWDEEKQTWVNWRGQKTGPGWALEQYITYLDTAKNTPTAQRARDILGKCMAQYDKKPNRTYAMITTPRCWPTSTLPFRLGRLAEAIRAAARNYSGKGQPGTRPGIALQRDDGSWGFTPTSDTRKLLGKEGESASGITARAALPILTYARMTGDKKFTESGLKALKCLDRFTVPRAAQVWEVPVHTPDILAAAYTLRCYLEGYKITGKKAYLKKAIRWGYAGLPFIYMWGVDDRPVMPFGGIAVYGCSFYVRNCWIGRPVQWCALDYAVAIQELAKYDDSFPWRHFAEGITLSGMRQQSAEGEFKGRYPDSWILRTDERCWKAMLDPHLIMQNVLFLTGKAKAPETAIRRSMGRDLRVTAVGGIKGLKYRAGVLSFELHDAPYQTSHLIVAGFESVDAVGRNGVPLAQAKDTDQVEEGWEFLPKTQIICLKLKTADSPITIRIKGKAKGGLLPG
ncbi:MAG: hypothetical protein GXP25_12295 [Planctomycetes bacterium]|nr:hypothetical protein [Planctomycetota bacterium]